MPRFVVLLRGVNVGTAKPVPMAAFKALLEGLGATAVQTVLNSGNAVFSHSGRATARHAQAISAALQAQLGVQVLVVVKTAAEWAAVVAAMPWPLPEAEHAKCLVAWGPDAASLRPLRALHSLVQPPEQWVVTENAAYLHCAHGILDSKVGAALLAKAGQGVTTRNWATVLKLQALVQPA